MRTLSIFVLIAIASTCSAQWSDDPNAPLAISQSLGTERYLQATEDDSGGWYLFWRDTPDIEGGISINGQHLDSEGNGLWTPDGKPIVHYSTAGTVSMYDMCRLSDGNILLVYGTHIGGTIADSLFAMLIDQNGDHLWSEALLLAQSGFPILRFESPEVIPSGSGAILAYRVLISGGQYETHVDRIESNGSIQFGVNGADLGTSAHGPFGLLSDASDGAFIHWRNSNGSGTHMGVMRLNAQCSTMWPQVIDPVEGTVGLTYQYRAIEDGSGGIAIVYEEGNPSSIKMVRLNENGAQVFDPPTRSVAPFASDQDSPRLLFHDNSYFIAWEDDRPPANNRDVYIQKLDMNGDPLWATEGVLGIQGSTYIPYSDLVASDNGSVIITQLMSVEGFLAQKISSEGNAVWTSATQLCTDPFAPFYEEYRLLSDGNGGAVSFWYNFESNDQYAAKVRSNGALAGPGCAEDITGDGLIDIQDFLALNSAFGSSCGGCPADVNNDGSVDILDFLQINSKFGQGCH